MHAQPIKRSSKRSRGSSQLESCTTSIIMTFIGRLFCNVFVSIFKRILCVESWRWWDSKFFLNNVKAVFSFDVGSHSATARTCLKQHGLEAFPYNNLLSIQPEYRNHWAWHSSFSSTIHSLVVHSFKTLLYCSPILHIFPSELSFEFSTTFLSTCVSNLSSFLLSAPMAPSQHPLPQMKMCWKLARKFFPRIHPCLVANKE